VVWEILTANEGAVRAREVINRHYYVHIVKVTPKKFMTSIDLRWGHLREWVGTHIVVWHLDSDVLQNSLR